MLASLGRLDEARAQIEARRAAEPRLVPHLQWRSVATGMAPAEYWSDRPTEGLPSSAGASPWPLSPHEMIVALVGGDALTGRDLARRGVAEGAPADFSEVRAARYLTELEVGSAWADYLVEPGPEALAVFVDAASRFVLHSYPVNSLNVRAEVLFFHLSSAMAMSSDPATRDDGIHRLRHGRFMDPHVWSLRWEALGKAYDAAGDTAAAIDAYERWVGLMSGSDHILQPRVQTARDRLAALGSTGN